MTCSPVLIDDITTGQQVLRGGENRITFGESLSVSHPTSEAFSDVHLATLFRRFHMFLPQEAVKIPVMCSDVVVYPYQLYQARLAGSDAVKLFAPALPDKVR